MDATLVFADFDKVCQGFVVAVYDEGDLIEVRAAPPDWPHDGACLQLWVEPVSPVVEGDAADGRDGADRITNLRQFERSAKTVTTSVTAKSELTKTVDGSIEVREGENLRGAELDEDGTDLESHLRGKSNAVVNLQQVD